MSIYVPPRLGTAVKAGPIGPGAGPLMTEFLLPNVLPNDPRLRMARAVQIGNEVAYVKAAEAVISQKIADPLLGVGWRLEDPAEETIDEKYADPKAVEAYNLVAKPMANASDAGQQFIRTREEIWEVTSRHMGLAGQGAWYLDGLNDFGIPSAIFYIRPDRLEWKDDHWLLDRKPGSEGKRLSADEVKLVQLQTPDEGVFAPGLVDAAYTKAKLNGAIDTHFAQVLAGGGRISGILAPRQGAIDDDGVYQQLIRDWRNITEQPESARRLQVVRAPIDFTKTVNTPDEMKLIDLMTRNRDDLLALWRVPLSQIGGSSPAGLNSGDVRKYDEAALWQNAVTPRLSRFQAVLQAILNNYESYLGWIPKLIFDIPEFDDDSPRFDKLQKSQFIPLTNDERRALINFEPLEDQALGAAIIMPNTMVPYEQLGQQPATSPSAQAQGAANIGAAAQGATAKAKDLASLDRGKQKGPDVTAAVLAALRKQWPADQLAVVKQGNWKYDPAYPLAKIDAARRPIARNPKIVAGVEDALGVGAPIDPVVLINVKRLGNGKPTEPIDGWHRLLAAQHAGLDTIPAYIGKGDDQWTKTLIGFDDTIPTPPDSPTYKADMQFFTDDEGVVHPIGGDSPGDIAASAGLEPGMMASWAAGDSHSIRASLKAGRDIGPPLPGDPSFHESGRALARAVDRSPVYRAPLFRGIEGNGAGMDVGQQFDLSLSSFTNKQSIAKGFARGGVIVKIEGGAKAFPMSEALRKQLGADSFFVRQSEYVTSGRFEVVSRSGNVIVIRQIATFRP